MISLQKIKSSSFNEILYKNLSITIFPGSIVNLYGENGSGKTSLLRIIAGLDDGYEGEINTAYDDFLSEVRYLGHEHGLVKNLTIEQNLKFFAKIYQHEILLDSAYSYFDLAKIKNKKITELSAGQIRMVALARLIIMPGKIWLLDEPFNNLDAKNTIKVKQLINAKVNDAGITILTTHKKIDFMDVINVALDDFR